MVADDTLHSFFDDLSEDSSAPAHLAHTSSRREFSSHTGTGGNGRFSPRPSHGGRPHSGFDGGSSSRRDYASASSDAGVGTSSFRLADLRPLFFPGQVAGTLRIVCLSDSAHGGEASFAYHFRGETLLVGSGAGRVQTGHPVLPDVRAVAHTSRPPVGWLIGSIGGSLIPHIRTVLGWIGRTPVYVPASSFGISPSDRPIAEALSIGQTKTIGGEFIIEPWVSGDRTLGWIIQAGDYRIAHATTIDALSEVHTAALSANTTLIGARLSVAEGDVYIPKNIARTAVFTGDRDISGEYEKSSNTASRMVVVPRGAVFDLTENGKVASIHRVRLFIDPIVCDGRTFGTAESPAFKDRGHLGQWGAVTIVFLADENTRTLMRPVRIEARGAFHPHEMKHMVDLVTTAAKRSYEEAVRLVPDITIPDLARILRQDCDKAIRTHSGRSPFIIPVILSV